MIVRDIMTTDVITVTADSHVLDAKRIMESKNFRRLPVVDNGKLVGIVTRQGLERVNAPSASNNIWELSYNLGSMYRTPVKDIMHTNMVTAKPEMTVEEALALAQSRKVGALVVVDDSGKVVGIVTTNDFFYRIVNPVLGVGESGQRVWVSGGGEGKALEDVISTVNKLCLEIVTLHIIKAPKAKKKDLVVHIRCDDPSKLLSVLKEKGYRTSVRKR